MFMKPFIFLLSCLAFFISCDQSENHEKDDPPLEITTEKPKYLWFDAQANFERFSDRSSICYYLDKTKETGFDQIVVDVRPVLGDVLYKKTSFMTELTSVGNYSRTIDWDYLQFFIDEAKKRGLKVTVSTTIFPAGSPAVRKGMAYRDEYWAQRTILQYTPDGMTDVRDDRDKVAAFLNPALPEVQEFALNFIREIVSNYDFDGYALDYCRYLDVEGDFSEASRLLFESYIGEKVTNFPEDIFRWDGTTRRDGKYAKKWFEFRAMVIHDFVKRAKEEIKKIKPDMKLVYFAASWYGSLYVQGQNWASKQYDPSAEYSSWASADYKNAGFAEHLDAFMIGTYLEKVYGTSDPESIEYGLARGRRLLKGDCKMYGSLYANNWENMEDAAYVALTQSDGLMVFDIVQVIQYDLWDELKRAIDKVAQETNNN